MIITLAPGLRCAVCADNHHGNPEIPGGSCIACNCNENVKYDEPGNCDPNTGHCLKCIFNTEGNHCEFCKPGFWGNATGGVCQNCVCDILGTDPKNPHCDRFTGDCHCLPNVEGRECDRYEVTRGCTSGINFA
jgi:coxsackievirus/adenovirus receptor